MLSTDISGPIAREGEFPRYRNSFWFSIRSYHRRPKRPRNRPPETGYFSRLMSGLRSQITSLTYQDGPICRFSAPPTRPLPILIWRFAPGIVHGSDSFKAAVKTEKLSFGTLKPSETLKCRRRSAPIDPLYLRRASQDRARFISRLPHQKPAASPGISKFE